MYSSNQAASGYSHERDRVIAGLQLYGSTDQESVWAADRYALLQAVADRKASGRKAKARRQLGWRRSPEPVAKTV